MILEIILRTCDSAQVHNDWRVRYCNLDKPTIVKGCFTSLINSCKNVNDIKLTVLDDNSTTETVDFMKTKLQESGVNHEFISLDKKGYNNSGVVQFEKCRDSNAEIVYSIEDDYLHCTTAIQELIESFYLFSAKIPQKPIVLYPFDEPSEYTNPTRAEYIVHGSRRHWRTGMFTTQVLMSTPKLFQEYWDLFHLCAAKYNGDYLKPRTEHWMETNTIWNIWNRGQAVRFNPIPSLALHLQFEGNRDPFINWEEWWKLYAS
jgi:hypothetical protein